MAARIAYLAQGRLQVLREGGTPQTIESTFAEDVVQRQERDRANNAWKQRGGDQDPLPPSLVWAGQARALDVQRPVIVGVYPGHAPDELLYVLRLTRSQGLFRYHLGRNEEQRILHRQEFAPVGLSACPRTGETVIANRTPEGVAHLDVMDRSEHHQGTITGGDAFDSQPCHDPRQPGVVWFQSAGAGRNAEGHLVAFGPAHLNRLDQANGSLETVVELPAHDCLAPQVDLAGNLYYIRRPWQAPGQTSAWGLLTDIVLFPFRVGRAVIDFLNVFSLMFSKKPLKTAGGAPGPEAAQGRVWLHGTLVDVQQASRRHRGPDGQPALVPTTWELIRRAPNGREEVLARSVSSFCVSPEGLVIATDGFAIRELAPTPRVLHRAEVIECLRLIP